MAKRHMSSTPSRSLSSSETIHFLNKIQHEDESLSNLRCTVEQSEDFVPIVVSEFCPPDRKKRYFFIQQLKKGLSSSINTVLYQYSAGGNIGNSHFLWKVPTHCSAEELANRNMQVVRDIEKDIPTYQTRFARREFCDTFGKFSGTPTHILREMFRKLTGDNSAPEYLSESQIDERVKAAILSEDDEIVVDLRHFNENNSNKFEVFFKAVETYLADKTTVQERRHTDITYLAKAISFRDLHEQVSKLVPEGTAIPSVQWLKWQFHPRHPRTIAGKYFKCKMNIKMMVQKRQFRKSHPDEHYCAAIWRYMREYAVLYRDICRLISLDDKHRVKIGEPGFPVAAAERGKQVLVGPGETFAVGDHDFTRFSIVPSVIFEVFKYKFTILCTSIVYQFTILELLLIVLYMTSYPGSFLHDKEDPGNKTGYISFPD